MVLDGAKALAIPTKFGQSLEISLSEGKNILWKSIDNTGEIWFESIFDIETFSPNDQTNSIALSLSKILKAAKELNPNFLSIKKGLNITTKLDFPRNWGLGTSSTLINNIAQWAAVDGFKLLAKSMEGSGYDIAAAQNDLPIVYKLQDNKPLFVRINLNWNFTDSLFFVYLNQKQDSKEGITLYKASAISEKQINAISEITEKLIVSKTLFEFEKLLQKHEEVISEIIKLPTVKERLFPDFPNIVKSLGAWGGDFILATGTESDMDYFRKKGFETVIPFRKMIK